MTRGIPMGPGSEPVAHGFIPYNYRLKVPSEMKLPLLLLNTTIATGLPREGDPDAIYYFHKILAEDGTRMVRDAIAMGIGVGSAIGHESTAQILSELLGIKVHVNRQAVSQQLGQKAIAIKLRGRAPEGVILNRQEIEEIGYDLYVMERIQSYNHMVSQARERLGWLADLGAVMMDLDRCQHGRHAGECYAPCPGASGWANPWLNVGQRLGTTVKGRAIVVPNKDVRDAGASAPWYRAASWLVIP